MGKLILFAAPSGAGKTTIVRHLLKVIDSLSFSVSATTRAKRSHEQEGVDYYFMSPDCFRQKIAAQDFVEWVEVYANQYYGTLRSEIERLWMEQRDIIFDIDVKGAMMIKAAYPKETLAIFVKPPSTQTLIDRLTARGTESAESLKKRIQRFEEELSYQNKFDYILVNDILSHTLQEAEKIVLQFIQDGYAHYERH
ncbi:MAG: guanylate kinase [Bacteroidota bacterium]